MREIYLDCARDTPWIGVIVIYGLQLDLLPIDRLRRGPLRGECLASAFVCCSACRWRHVLPVLEMALDKLIAATASE